MRSMKVSDWSEYSRIRQELSCSHAVGHAKGIHGCDGCCGDPTFREAWKKIFGDEKKC